MLRHLWFWPGNHVQSLGCDLQRVYRHTAQGHADPPGGGVALMKFSLTSCLNNHMTNRLVWKIG